MRGEDGAAARARYWRAIGVLFPIGLVVIVLEFVFVYPARDQPLKLVAGLLAGIALFGLVQGLVGLWAGAIPKLETGGVEFAYGWEATLRGYLQSSLFLVVGLACLALFAG